MDVSLDEYIGSTSGANFRVQIRNTPVQRNVGGNAGFSGRGNVQGHVNIRGRGRGRGGVQPRNLRGGRVVGMSKVPMGGISTGNLRGRSRLSRGGVNVGNISRNLTVSTGPSGFDARAKILASKKPLDAREKLSLKAKQTDARSKIANLKAKNTGKTTNDARMFISNKLQTGQGGNKVRLGTGGITANISIKRTLQTGPQGSAQLRDGSITRTIPGGEPASSVSFGQGGNPVIQIKNDQFHKPAKAATVKVNKFYYGGEEEEEEEEEDYVPQVKKPLTYLVEKTLTVKTPQLLPTSSFPQTLPKRQPQVVKKSTVISTKKPTPIRFDSSDSDVIDDTHRELKRKASSAPSSGPLKLAKSAGYGPGVPSLSLDGPKVFKSASIPEDDLLTETQLASTVGFRVIVSNLHTVVVQNDIIELFGAIGPIKRARLLKEGVAEVVYLNKEDVQKAIQKYNNRELDGLPMQVKLYTPPKPKKAAPENIVGNVKDVEGPLKLGKDNPKKGSDVDLGVLHKALFKTGAPNKTKVSFTVKV